MGKTKTFTIFAIIGSLAATSAMAGGSTVTTGPTIPYQGVTATSIEVGGTASILGNAYSDTFEEDTQPCSFCTNSGSSSGISGPSQ